MSRHLLGCLLLMGCVPKLEPGPKPVEQWATPQPLLHQAGAAEQLHLAALIKAGSSFDPPGREGLANLTAAALFDGGAGSRSADELRAALYPTGGELDVQADRDWVSVRLSCLQTDADFCIELFTDVLARPRFEPKAVERLRSKAMDTLGTHILQDEEALGDEVFDNWIFEAHPYGHPTQGRTGALEMLDATSVEAFYRRTYVRSQIWVGASGPLTEPQKVTLEQALQQLPPTSPVDRPLRQPVPVAGPSLTVVSVPTPVTGFHLGHPLQVDRDHPDWVALQVAITAFGAHRRSFGRLFTSLRTERGLNYGTYAYTEPFIQRPGAPMPENGLLREQNMFTLWIRPTSIDNGPFALKLAIWELEQLIENGLSQKEFEDTVSFLQGSTPLLAPTPERQLLYALDSRASRTPNPLITIPEGLQQLSLDTVNQAIQRHLRTNDLRIVAVTGAAEALVEKLSEENPTPIVYADVTPSEAQAAQDQVVSEMSLDLSVDRTWIIDSEGIFR